MEPTGVRARHLEAEHFVDALADLLFGFHGAIR
jgi:hypothetical protein